ncbi:MAG: OmpH family outer membrane protein [Gammaproteobacteria bacterium]|jgi:outer membrane protein|nr:OmpH family outer membrane protein [Gammaproteobacteria bacterium]
MKKTGITIFLAGMLAISSATVLAETKIGFVDTVKLLESAPQAKSAQSKIESEFAPREKELVAMQREIKKLEDDLSRDGAVMSESERTKQERNVLSKRRDLKRSQDEFRDDLNIRRNEVLAKLQKDMFQAVVSLAKEQNFDLILSQGVVYSSDKVDITDSVLKKLQK